MLRKVIDRMCFRLAKILCAYRGKPIIEFIESKCADFHRGLSNQNFDMESNGELRVLAIVSSFKPKCIFDVGANVGDWSAIASKLNPSSTIHAFEIVPSTYEILLKSTSNLPNILQINQGLSSKEESILISIGSDSCTATGCTIDGMRYHNEFYTQEVECNVKRAREYILENNLTIIDFVKIDVEGMDFQVIKGFEDLVQNVRIFQFEYGIFNISSHDLLADFCRHLNANGFVVGKIFPRCVIFFEYHFDMENFYGSNFVAVRADEKELIEKLQCYSS